MSDLGELVFISNCFDSEAFADGPCGSQKNMSNEWCKGS